MQQYLNLIDTVLKNGTFKEDRTGTGTLSVFGHQMRFDLTKGFPLVTTKKVHLKSIIHELLWFLSGDTNIKYLQDNGVKIWDEWADENGDLGPVYGSQWRSWPGKVTVNEYGNSEEIIISPETLRTGIFTDCHIQQESIDQISNLINDLKTNPDSRRLIVSAWNVTEIPNMKLPPCHAFFQFYTSELSLEERDALSEFPHAHRGYRLYSAALQKDKFATEEMHKLFDEQNIPRRRLSCQLYQRSADIFLGVPFNIASYALLTHMVAQQVNMVVGDFIWTGGDCHLYTNHLDQAKTQLERAPFPLPTLVIKRKPESIFDYKYEDFEILNYESHPHLAGKVAV